MYLFNQFIYLVKSIKQILSSLTSIFHKRWPEYKGPTLSDRAFFFHLFLLPFKINTRLMVIVNTCCNSVATGHNKCVHIAPTNTFCHSNCPCTISWQGLLFFISIRVVEYLNIHVLDICYRKGNIIEPSEKRVLCFLDKYECDHFDLWPPCLPTTSKL